MTGRPQPRGALVIGRNGSDADIVVRRLRASKWEVLTCADDLSVFPTTAEKARLERLSSNRVKRLPR